MRKSSPPCVVTIAGTDPSGGAGIQADIKTISATGSYAASIITALVAQNTCGVQAILDVSPAFIQQQIDSVFSDLDVQAVKIGMLHNEHVIDVVAAAMQTLKPTHIVFDPVMVAKNGCALIDPNTIDFLKQRLLPLVTVVTPNIPEAETLMGESITTFAEMEHAAITLGERYQVDVLMKGGHLSGEHSSDVLYSRKNGHSDWFQAERIDTLNTHGTGCTLSSAIASYLAQHYTLYNAVSAAKHYLTQAIRSGSHFKIGHGHGPVDHFYFL
ncbi:MAG TPA: bifunctional hydroxymethylpyrimidine kinase/phosphomethylpyrimidine kinase [Legionella sp.]|nr:bifunctional hydroxymethylpyrimidine kinase/phosphomethylpyrimidine kinase [Legionella sp.]